MPASRACSVPSGHKWGEILLDMQRSPGTQRSPGDQEGGMGSRTAPAPPCKGQAPRLVTFLRVSGRRPRTLLPAAGTPPGHIWPHILKSELPSSRLPLGDTPHFRSCKTVLPFSAPPLSSQRGRGEASTPGATVHSRPHQRFSEEGPDGSTTGEGVRRAAEPVGGGGGKQASSTDRPADGGSKATEVGEPRAELTLPSGQRPQGCPGKPWEAGSAGSRAHGAPGSRTSLPACRAGRPPWRLCRSSCRCTPPPGACGT